LNREDQIMARQATNCVPPSGIYSWGQGIFAGASGAALTAPLITAAAGGGAALAIGIGVVFALYGGLSGYCDWYFNHRLVCIRDSVTAVATVHTTNVGFDGDFCLEVLLAPTAPGSTLAELQAGPQGFLMVNQFPALPYEPDPPGGSFDWNGTPLLETEIEGTRMASVCAGGTVGSILGGAAGAAIIAACVAAGWTLIGLILCVIAALIAAALITAAGAGIGYLAGDEASPSDAGETREISANDCVVMRGRWIYDSGHSGYNEIHAIMRIMKLDEPCQKLSPDRIKVLIAHFDKADDANTQKRQLSQDDKRFLVHPSVG
jgi:hypothetical protein